MRYLPAVCSLFVIAIAVSTTMGQGSDATRLRALREKARIGTLTSEEKGELEQAMRLRGAGRATPPPGTPKAAGERRAVYLERQTESLARMRRSEQAACVPRKHGRIRPGQRGTST